jgi:hypothetical protein
VRIQLHFAGEAECRETGNKLLDNGQAPVTVGLFPDIIGAALVD